jgi:hypothetical protein
MQPVEFYESHKQPRRAIPSETRTALRRVYAATHRNMIGNGTGKARLPVGWAMRR